MGIQQNLFTWIVLCKRNSLKPNVMFLQNIKKEESVENKKEGGDRLLEVEPFSNCSSLESTLITGTPQ